MFGFDRKNNGKNSNYMPGKESWRSTHSNPGARAVEDRINNPNRLRMMNEMANANWKNRPF